MTSGSANCCPSSLLASCILAGVSAAVPAASVTPQASQPPPSATRHLLRAAPGSWTDELAALTTGPDAGFAELTARYRADPRLTVPATVFNGVLKRVDEV